MTHHSCSARIIGLGSYLPQKLLCNSDLEKIVDTSDEWIISRTGMKQRRIAAPDEATSDMGLAAARDALESCCLPTAAVDMVLVATMSADYITPSTSALIQAGLGAHNAAALDIGAACTGFIYGLSLAKAYIESGAYRHVLVIGAEKLSTFVDYTDRNTCILFGDGAAAAVVADRGVGLAIDGLSLGVDGSQAGLISVPAGGSRHPTSALTMASNMHYIRMEGREVFKHAVRRMASSIQSSLEKAGLRQEQISWMIPHQANERIIDALAKQFSLREERIYKTVHKYGNTSASSIPIALHELVSHQRLLAGDRLLLVAFGAGLTWGSAILTQMD